VREGKHLTLSTAALFAEAAGPPRLVVAGQRRPRGNHRAAGYGSFLVVMADRQQGIRLPFGMPAWIAELLMPLCLALMALAVHLRSRRPVDGRVAALLAIGATFALASSAAPLPQRRSGRCWR